MKVMLRVNDLGRLLAYVAKKDLEEEVLLVESMAGGQGSVLTLANGWTLDTAWSGSFSSPVTVEARLVRKEGCP